MSIDYSEDAVDTGIKAEVVRLKDEGDGVTGIIFDATARDKTDFETGDVVLNKHGKPQREYVYNIAASKVKGTFTERDGEGAPVKLANGRNSLVAETRKDVDVCVITSQASLHFACKDLKLNTGHEVKIVRKSPAGTTRGLLFEVEVLGKHDNPKRFEEPKQTIADTDYDDGEEPF